MAGSPVRVKLYGLKWVTRRAYLVRQAVILVLGLGIIAVTVWYPRPKLVTGQVVSPLGQWLLWLLNLLPWLAGLLLLLYGLETAIVLRLFARKEAALRPAPPPPAAADAPPSAGPPVPIPEGGPAQPAGPPPDKSEVS